jgi:hypothetical protein
VFRVELRLALLLSFSEKTINALKILLIPPVARFQQENHEHRVGQDFFFAAVSNTIRIGSSECAN